MRKLTSGWYSVLSDTILTKNCLGTTLRGQSCSARMPISSASSRKIRNWQSREQLGKAFRLYNFQNITDNEIIYACFWTCILYTHLLIQIYYFGEIYFILPKLWIMSDLSVFTLVPGIWCCISLSGKCLLYNSSSILQSQFCSCTVLLRSGVVARFD